MPPVWVSYSALVKLDDPLLGVTLERVTHLTLCHPSCMEQDQKFVEDTIKAIVNHPDAVKTERTVDDRGVLISLTVHPEDMGYVIGKGGQTARSVRTLLRIVGAKSNLKVTMKIVEPEGSRGPRTRQEAAVMEGTDESVSTSAVDDLTI